jgi:hypothetical protein
MDHFNLKESDRDPIFNSFVKIETYPKDNKSLLTTPIDEWTIIVDEESIPSWYENDRESYETIIRKEASSWLNKINTKHWDNATSEECYGYATIILKGPFPLGEKNIAKDAMYSFLYAHSVLKERFILGEKAIATNAHYSYYYAKCILKGPFPLGQKAIAKSDYYSYLYAMNILKRRFILGEKAIAENAHYSLYYAKDVLKGRFKLGEKAIATNAHYSYCYAKDVLNGRFKLGEKAIAKDKHLRKYYLMQFIKPVFRYLNSINKHQKKNKKKTFSSIQLALDNLPVSYIMHILN